MLEVAESPLAYYNLNTYLNLQQLQSYVESNDATFD